MHDHNKHGFSLIETMIAMLILIFALVSMAQLLGLAIVVNKNQGRDAAKATGFAHDKMEELNGLAFDDKVSVMFKDNLLRCRESESRSMRLCRKERLEQLCMNFGRDTAASVSDHQLHEITHSSRRPCVGHVQADVVQSQG